LVALLGLASCGLDPNQRLPGEDELNDPKRARRAPGSLTGEGGLFTFGVERNTQNGNGGQGIGVNAFLWRATLDTVSFMPLASADPFGGVVITDWYEAQGARGERFKVNAFILGSGLRSDGVRVAVFRQVADSRTGGWIDAPVSSSMAGEVEDKILARARELRSDSLASSTR